MESVQWEGFELGGTTGALIIDEEKPPEVDQDLVLIFEDWRIGTKGKIDDASFESMHDISHAGRLGNILTVNCNFSQDFPVLSGQCQRLRLINVVNARVMFISFDGHDALVVALDGQPVDRPFTLARNTILLALARRKRLRPPCSAARASCASVSNAKTTRRCLRQFGEMPYEHPRSGAANLPLLKLFQDWEFNLALHNPR